MPLEEKGSSHRKIIKNICFREGDMLELPLPVDNTTAVLRFSNKNVSSILDIKNIEAYSDIPCTIHLNNVKKIPNLVDFSMFKKLSWLYVINCGLESLEGLENVKSIHIGITNNGLELADNIQHVEALWNARGRKQRNAGYMTIDGNTIMGKNVLKYNSMTLAKTVYYIKEWIGRRS